MIGKVFKLDQLRGFVAYQLFCAAYEKEGRPSPTRVMVGNCGLVMGDLNACDWAVESHLNLLFASGGLQLGDLILNRRPLPRGCFLQGVFIDDRFVLTIGRHRDPILEARALQAMSCGKKAYEAAGLQVSAKKSAAARHLKLF